MRIIMISELQTFVFSFMPELSHPIVSLISVGTELRSEGEYYYDNTYRNLNGYLFQYTLEGKGGLTLSGHKHIIEPRQAFFIKIPSDTMYYSIPGEDWKFIYILIQSDYLDEYYQQIVHKTGNIINLSPDSNIAGLLNDIFNQAKNNHITNFNLASSLAYEFINKLYAHFMVNSDNYSKRNREIVHMLETDFDNIESISSISEYYNISTSHLTREFTEEVGISPIKYLTKVRITYARKLLQSTNMSVAEISKLCGYSRSNYFCKIFKEVVGISPLVYRTYLA